MDKKREVEVNEYWQSKEQELGEPILLRSISHTYQSEGSESFGVLFASQGHLVYEYSKSTRKSILEVLFSRREEKLSEQVKIPRAEIRGVARVPTFIARGWCKRGAAPAQVLARLESAKPSPFFNLLSGSCVCVCTESRYLALDTPINRQWVELLGK